MMYTANNEKIFSVSSGQTLNELFVDSKGNIKKIIRYNPLFTNPMVCTKDTEFYEYYIETFIESCYKNCSIKEFKEFVNALNKAERKKYFDMFYIPKEFDD